MTTWEQVRDAEDKAQQMMNQTASMGFETVMQFARVGQMLIELKKADDLRREEEGGRQNFSLQCEKFLPKMNHNTRSQRMKLAVYLPLLEQHRPKDQQSALALIKAQNPPKPRKPKVLPTHVKDEDEMKKEQFSWQSIAIDEGVFNGNSGGNRQKIRAEIDALVPGAVEAKNAEAVQSACRQILIARQADKSPIEATRTEIKTLPEKAQQKLARLEATLTHQLEADFDRRVREAAKAMIPDLIKQCEEREREATEELRNFATRKQGIKPHLTEADYRFLRQTIAPDRYPEEYRDKLTKAAQIINQFDKYVEAFKVA